MSSQRQGHAAEDPDLTATHSAGAPFASRAFFWLWLANTISALGTWIQNTASAWIMTDLSPSPLMVSLVQAAAQLPVLVLALPAGALADLMDRKRHLILTNMLMLAAAVILALVAALGRLDATLLLSLTVLLAVGAALNSPAWAASVPLTVPRRSLTQALVLTSIGFNIARAIGPALGGLLLAVAGATAAFAANAVSFAFVVVVAGFLLAFPRTQTTIDVPPEPFRSAMRIGLAYALAEPVVRSTLVRSAAFFGCASAIWALLPLYVRQVLGLSSASFGLMMGVIGAGAVLGGLMMPQLHRLFSRNNLIMLAGASCSLALVPLAVIPGVTTAYAALLVFGIGWIVGASNLQATVQLATAPWVRARVLALYQAVFNGGMGLGAIFWGALGEHAGLPGTIFAAGLGGGVIALLTRAVQLPAEIGDPSAPAISVPRVLSISEEMGDEQYAFDFEPFHSPPSLANYFDFPATEHTAFAPEEVVLFSGGLDSLGGAVEEVLGGGKRVALVSHRSAAKISSVQKYLVDLLSSRAPADSVLHVPVLATLTGDLNREPTHRARSFLFAALGAVTARLFGVSRIRFFENGIVSLNLPPVRQVVGARATRTTHPQALAGFRRIFGAVFNRDFEVTNPFMWLTKPDVIGRIVSNGCSDLIKHSRSCTRVRDMTTLHPHCGECSQCIDRRFAILATGQDHEDPAEAYKVDLFTDARSEGPDREMALAYVRSASEVDRMAEEAFFARFGEISRVVGYFPEPAEVVATRVLELHRRHASAVCRVFDQAVASHASALREGTLAGSSLLVLKVSRLEGAQTVPEPVKPDLSLPAAREIRLAADRGAGRIIFERWGPIKGTGAKLISTLLAEFDQATQEKLSPEHYPFVSSRVLARQLACDSDETLRRQVLRLRNSIRGLAESAGEHAPDDDAVIENQPGRGYRLNPDSVRVVQVTELRRSVEVTPARPKRHASKPRT